MISSVDIEKLYKRIEGKLNSIPAYINEYFTVNILKACRLKPYSLFKEGEISNNHFDPHWVDEFGNSIYFENKTHRIVSDDKELKIDTKTSTDLFRARHPQQLVSDGKFILVAEGMNSQIICICGKDEYYRAFIWEDGWKRISPLLFGIRTLHEMNRCKHNILLSNIRTEKLDFVLPFEVKSCLVSGLPARQSINITLKEIEL